MAVPDIAMLGCSKNYETIQYSRSKLDFLWKCWADSGKCNIVFALGSGHSLSTAKRVVYLCFSIRCRLWYSQHIHSNIHCTRNLARLAWPKYVEDAEHHKDSESITGFANSCHQKKSCSRKCSYRGEFVGVHYCKPGAEVPVPERMATSRSKYDSNSN